MNFGIFHGVLKSMRGPTYLAICESVESQTLQIGVERTCRSSRMATLSLCISFFVQVNSRFKARIHYTVDFLSKEP